MPEPKTWDELAKSARTILDKERNGSLQGLSVQGAPIEGAVCTFLLPYWSQGKELTDAAGKLTLDKPAAVASMKMFLLFVLIALTGIGIVLHAVLAAPKQLKVAKRVSAALEQELAGPAPA